MHVNTPRQTMPGTAARESARDEGTETERMSPTSVLLVALAVLGVVVTFVFGLWMIDFAQTTTVNAP